MSATNTVLVPCAEWDMDFVRDIVSEYVPEGFSIEAAIEAQWMPGCWSCSSSLGLRVRINTANGHQAVTLACPECGEFYPLNGRAPQIPAAPAVESKPSEDVAEGMREVLTGVSLTAAVARMLLRDKDAQFDKGVEYGFDRGYWSAMVDIMRHLVAWEADGLGMPIADMDDRYSGFNAGDEMIRHQLNIFFDEAAASWGEPFPAFEEWSA